MTTRYRLHQTGKTIDGEWVSPVFEHDARHARQNVLAGYTSGHRWAVDEDTGRVICGIRDNREYTPAQ